MKINLKIVNNSGHELPAYASEGASCVDIRVPTKLQEITIAPKETYLVPTGLQVQIPIGGFELQIRSRSGLALNKKLIVLNSPGTVDEDYRGEIGVILFNASNETVTIKAGERIAQMALCPVNRINWVECVELDKSERGSKGFGSTGIN